MSEREHTSSSPSSFTSFQLRGVELTSSFEDDELEPSVASEARGFLKARSVKFFAPESGEPTRDGSRVSDLRLGAIDEKWV